MQTSERVMQMNKHDIARYAAEAVVFSGVSTVVDNGVKKIMPEETKLHKRILAKIGGWTISAAITHVVAKEIKDTVDELHELKDELEKQIQEIKDDTEHTTSIDDAVVYKGNTFDGSDDVVTVNALNSLCEILNSIQFADYPNAKLKEEDYGQTTNAETGSCSEG